MPVGIARFEKERAQSFERKSDSKAAEFVADQIRERILDGLYSPGQRLIEADLIGELNASRSSIRPAFLKLEAEGFVESRHQRGSFVRKLSRQDLIDLFIVRERLEGLAAYLAAQNIDKGGFRVRMEELRTVWMQRDVIENQFRHLEENVPFHDLINEMAGNSQLTKLLQPMTIPGYRAQYFKILDRETRLRSAREHIDLADAILNGNPEKSEQIMRQHVREAGELALRLPGID